MSNSLKFKIAFLSFLVIFSVIAVVPSFKKDVPEWWKKYMAPEGFKLGLDLQGGLHVVLRADLEKAVANSLAFASRDLKEGLADKNITAIQLESNTPNQALFTLPNIGAVDQVKQIVEDDFPKLNLEVDSKEGSFPRITIHITDEQIEFIRKNAIDQSLEIIRNRIDQFGVAEPVLIKQGDDELVVQLPGLVEDRQRALKLIQDTAQLEFKLVADTGGINLKGLINEAVEQGILSVDDREDTEKLNLALKNRLPRDTEIAIQKDFDKTLNQKITFPILLESSVLMTGEMIKDAQHRIGGQFNEHMVNLEMTGRGARVFGNITEKNVGRQLAIVLDGIVQSAPVLREKILGGRAQISGSFTSNEASDLAIALRVGALPTSLQIIQNMSVEASLGDDSIHKGLNSGMFGTLLVLLFMTIYYRLSGVIANWALALNILFLFVGLAAIPATLTLPGIAGIILSIGMAVDANVLIFERMREEFALGKSPKSGVDSGFDKAFWSIVDSQVTTLITALALFLFGTGPIKGFAVTLSLGIIFNLFAVLFCTRLVYETMYSTRKLKKINFRQFIKKPNYNFLGIRKFTFSASAVLVLMGVVAFVQIMLGHANLGVDFSGGSMLQFKAEQSFNLDEVRTALRSEGWDSVNPQKVRGEERLILKLKNETETVGGLGETFSTILNKKLPEKKFALESESEIGSSISEMLRDKAIEAILISLFGVLCYLALRFDLSYGIAAAAATFHDVLVVLGICWLMDIEMTLLIVTALLTLAGYSLNDSVVVFDRIRENIQKDERKPLLTILNESINQVLGRSMVTSLTTLLVLLSLFFFGGPAIHDFSFALLVGIIIGTYSSVFIASPLLTILPRKEH